MFARLAGVCRTVPDGRAVAALLVLCCLLFGWQIGILREKRLAGEDLVASDGKFYYVYLPSVLFDHDLDFENDYDLIGARRYLGETTFTREGYVNNLFTSGPALLWTPFFLAGHATTRAANLLLGTGYAADGYGPLETGAVVLGNCLYAYAGMFFLFFTLRRRFDSYPSLLAVVAVALCTSMIFYLGDRAFFPVATQVFAISFVLNRTLFVAPERVLRSTWTMGLAAGLVILVKATDILVLAIPGVVLLPALLKELRQNTLASLKRLALAALIIAAINAPKIYIKQVLHPWGDPRLLTGFVHAAQPFIFEQLFSTRRGLLTWAPALWLALPGMYLFWRRDRRAAFACLLVIVLLLYVNGVSGDWWGGRSPGTRRLANLLPLLALPLAGWFDWVARRWRAAAAVLVAVLAVDSYLLYRVFVVDPGFRRHTVSFVEVTRRKADLLTGAIGYPASFPATLLVARRYGISVQQAELIWGVYYDTDFESLDFGADADLYLGRGWSQRIGDDGGITFRTTTGENATILVGRMGVPVRMRQLDSLVLRARIVGATAGALRLELNGSPLRPVANDTMSADWGELRFEIDPVAWRGGINELVMSVSGKARRIQLVVDRIELRSKAADAAN